MRDTITPIEAIVLLIRLIGTWFSNHSSRPKRARQSLTGMTTRGIRVIIWGVLSLVCLSPAFSKPVEMPIGFIRPSGVSTASLMVDRGGDLLLSLGSVIWRVGLTCRVWVEEGEVKGEYRAKFAALRERGLIPAVSIGFDEKPFVAISKTFNLPIFQLISFHLTIRGDFRVGVWKRFDLSAVKSSFDLKVEGGSGGGMIGSARIESEEGAWIGLLYECEGNGFWVEVGFSSEGLLSGVKGAERLAKQAGKLAVKALRKGGSQPPAAE